MLNEVLNETLQFVATLRVLEWTPFMGSFEIFLATFWMSSWTATSLMIASKSHSEKQIKRALARKSKDVDVKESNNNSQLNHNHWSCSIYLEYLSFLNQHLYAWSATILKHLTLEMHIDRPASVWYSARKNMDPDVHMYAAWYKSSTQTSLQMANIVEVHRNDSGPPAGQYVLPQDEHCSVKASGLGVPVASKWIKLKSDWAAWDDGVLLAYGGLLLQDNVSVSFRGWETSSHYSLCLSLHPHDTRLQGRNLCEG